MGRPRKTQRRIKLHAPKAVGRPRGSLRTSEHAPGIEVARAARQPKQPKPGREPRELRVLSDGEMQELLASCLDRGEQLYGRKKGATKAIREHEREIRAQGGSLAVSMHRFQVKCRDPEQVDEIKAKIRAQHKALRFLGQDPLAIIEEPRPRPHIVRPRSHIVRPQVSANDGQASSEEPPEAA